MNTRLSPVIWSAIVLLLALLFLTPVVAHAAPVIGYPITVTQPDGTVLHLFVSGDEYYHWVYDANGYTVVQDPQTGFYVYANLVNDTLSPSSLVVGKSDPAKAGLRAKLNISPTKEESLRQQSIENAPYYGSVLNGPKTGTVSNLAIFIRFSGDAEWTTPTSTYSNMLNSTTSGDNSLLNYFREASYNQLTIQSNLYPIPGATIISYLDSHARGYYSPYDVVTNPDGYTGGRSGTQRWDREYALLQGALNYVKGLNQFPDAATVDRDGDGNVDAVTFIVKGGPDPWAELLWPHKSQFVPNWLFQYPVQIAGKNVVLYNLQIESMTTTEVLAHEMFHVVGAPDLYHYSDTSTYSPVGSWDLMDTASWYLPPPHMGCYMKWKYGGWIPAPTMLTGFGTRNVKPLASSSTDNCFRINSPNSSSEYFIVEYRNWYGFDNSIDGEGLLVYRINSSVSGGNRNGPPDEVYLYRPGGTTTADGTLSQAAFSSTSGRTEINDSTAPSSFLSNGSAGGLNISNVTAPGDSISFDYAPKDAPHAATLVSPTGSTAISTPTYTWNAVNNATWYRLWVGGPSGKVIDTWYTATQTGCASGTGTCSIAPTTALKAGAHQWWVQTWNEAGKSGPWSSSMDFNVLQVAAATLVSPNSTVTVFAPTFTWNAVSNSTWYYLWINGPAGTTLHKKWYTASEAGCGSGTGTCSITPIVKLDDGSHTWWIQTWNDAGSGPWSSSMSFPVVLPKPPAATLISPTGMINTGNPTFSWNAVSNSTWYYLWISGPSGSALLKRWYTAAQVGCSGGTGTCSLSSPITLANGAHKWWVQTWNDFGDGPWSSTMNFTVSNTVGFDSEFTGDASGWQPHLGSWSIAQSQWYTTPITAFTWPSTSFAADFSDFQYEVRLWRGGCWWCANSIWVRGTPGPLQNLGGGPGEWNSGYLFEYSSDGWFSVWREYPGGYDGLQYWTETSAINQGAAWNTVRVAANGSSLSYYINGVLVWSGTDTLYSSGRVGIAAWGNGTSGDQLWADYATLNVGSFYSPAQQVSAEQQALNAAAMQSATPCMDKTRSCNATAVKGSNATGGTGQPAPQTELVTPTPPELPQP